MGDFFVGAEYLVRSRRGDQQVVGLEAKRHPRRALIHWRAVRMAYLDHRVRRLHPSGNVGAEFAGGIDLAGGHPIIEIDESDKVSLITELLKVVIWPWAAFEMVKKVDDPVDEWRWRVYCTAIANPDPDDPDQSIPHLLQGGVYILLEPAQVDSELAAFQAFEVSWTRGQTIRARRRALASDPWRGRFLQNEDRQRSGDD